VHSAFLPGLIPLHSSAEVHALSRSVRRDDFGPGTQRECLVIDARDPAVARDIENTNELSAWLANLPCPVIALSSTNNPDVPFCDLVLTELAELAAVKKAIARAPLAAMTLAQLLRLIERLPDQQALVAESFAYATLQGGKESCRLRRPGGAALGGTGPAVLLNRCGSCLSLSLNRPDNHNALSIEVRDALVEAFELAWTDDSITEIMLDGVGRCFSVGGDLTEFGQVTDPATAHWVRSIRLPAYFASRCAKVLTVRVHGACIGAGVEIAAFAHHFTAARNSFFQLPELRMGLIPGAGGCVSITRRIGRQRTAYMALSGRRFTSETALSWGLIDSIVD
jgi:enoyl-CoA hydratase